MTKVTIQERLTDYDKAVNRLQEGVQSELKDSIVVDGVIQRFEYTFELAWNILKEFLEFEGIAGIRCPRGAIKEGSKVGLLEDSEAWIEMMTERNRTSYIYEEDQAKEAYDKIKDEYAILLEKLLKELKRHIEHK